VQNSYVGTDVTGARGLGNGAEGIIVRGPHNTIGADPYYDLVISDNGTNGITITGPAAVSNYVQYNLIGTDVTGKRAWGNHVNGILIDSASNNIVSGNTIEFNSLDGVLLRASSGATTNSYGNQIGYGSAWLQGGYWGTIPSGYGNTIALNGSNGVEVLGQHMVGNPTRGNSIYGNHNLGIARQYSADWGAPTLLSAQSGAVTVVSGVLYTSFSYAVSFSVDFYASAAADSPGAPQGRRYLGTLVVTAVNGFASFTAALSGLSKQGEIITATATDYWGTTTAFSSGVTAK
jgi:parallel beta-helix repeat protein